MTYPLRAIQRVLAVLIVGAIALCATPARGAPGVDWPLSPAPDVTEAFDLPPQPWLPGHRGVDLAASAGQAVRAAADGVVAFAGTVAGRGVISIDHATVRTTYEPVEASVASGDVVLRGQIIGTVIAGHQDCSVEVCLHWGARLGEQYVDPLTLLTPHAVRLLPLSSQEPTPGWAGPSAQPGSYPHGAGYTTVHPAPGGIFTSGVGPRWGTFHSGIDLAAEVGTPVYSATSGVVIAAGAASGFGQWVVIDPGTDGWYLIYGHVDQYFVAAGQQVTAGQQIATVGNRGQSTGPHLHFEIRRGLYGGQRLDPQKWLSERGIVIE
ncbi:MAG: M23 family metallopeptidase [Cumulibacter sp.]